MEPCGSTNWEFSNYLYVLALRALHPSPCRGLPTKWAYGPCQLVFEIRFPMVAHARSQKRENHCEYSLEAPDQFVFSWLPQKYALLKSYHQDPTSLSWDMMGFYTNKNVFTLMCAVRVCACGWGQTLLINPRDQYLHSLNILWRSGFIQ